MLRLTAEQYRTLPIVAKDETCFGKTYIITGSNSGLGLETARHLVEFKATRVVLAVRNLAAGETAKNDIEKTTKRTGIIEVSNVEVWRGKLELILLADNAPRHGILRVY